jgi:hypothetical protein
MPPTPSPTLAPYWCRMAYPGLVCGYTEMLVLGILFWVCALASLFLLIHAIRKSKRCVVADQTVLFWVFLAIWQIYRGLLLVVPFHWAPETLRIGYTSVEQMVMFVPMCLVILLLFDLLFTYRNPGTNAMFFFRSLFFLFLVTFMGLGILLCVFDSSNENSDADLSMSLWCACTDLVLAIFFALPAPALLEAVTYPMVQKEDEFCVNFCKVGIVVYVLLYGGRALWNGTHYFGVNVVQSWMARTLDPDGRPAVPVRVLVFAFFFVFDLVSSVLAMVCVYLFREHENMFSENPYYTRGR